MITVTGGMNAKVDVVLSINVVTNRIARQNASKTEIAQPYVAAMAYAQMKLFVWEIKLKGILVQVILSV